MSRESILHRVRTALGRSAGQTISEPPAVRLRVPEVERETRIASMLRCVEALAGKTYRAATMEDARAFVAAALAGRSAVASNAPFLAECGIIDLPGVQSGIRQHDELLRACVSAGVGITSADYALCPARASSPAWTSCFPCCLIRPNPAAPWS
jgi:hypothetical protein